MEIMGKMKNLLNQMEKARPKLLLFLEKIHNGKLIMIFPIKIHFISDYQDIIYIIQKKKIQVLY